MSIATAVNRRAGISKKAQEDKEEAPDAAKPLYDMLSLWTEFGNPGDPSTDSEYAEKIEELMHDWAEAKGLPLSLYMPGKSPITPAEAPEEASKIIDKGLSLVTVLNSIGILAEVASLGFIESVIDAMTNIINASGLPGIISDLYRTPMEVGVKIPLYRAMMRNYQPNIPEARALTSLRARGMLAENAYNWLMQEHGYPEWASELMAYSETRYPDISFLLDLFRRNIISPETFRLWVRRVGYHPNTVEAFEKLRWQIPSYQDIISVYMREGYMPEKWTEIPEEFLSWMRQLGYDEYWTLRLWGKHWVLPSVDLLYEMFWKKIISYDDMVQMLKYHDFEPVWRERLIANAYRAIPRVDLRRAYRYGRLRAEELQERYEWLGFRPEDANIMSDIALRESLDRYYTRLETVARSAYRKGKLSREGLLTILRQINTPEEAISLVLEAEDLAREAAVLEPAEEPRQLTASQVLTLFQKGIIDRDVALTRLSALGFQPGDAALLIQLYEPKPTEGEVRADLISAAAALYREGLMSQDEFEAYLRRAGLSPGEVQSKVEAENLRYRLDYAKDLIALIKEAYKKDVYTEEEALGYLLYHGMQLERAQALLALESLRKLPKPKAS